MHHLALIQRLLSFVHPAFFVMSIWKKKNKLVQSTDVTWLQWSNPIRKALEDLLYFCTLNLMSTMDHLRWIGFHPYPSTCFVRSHGCFNHPTYHPYTVRCMVKRKCYPFLLGHLMTISSTFIRLSQAPTIVNRTSLNNMHIQITIMPF